MHAIFYWSSTSRKILTLKSAVKQREVLHYSSLYTYSDVNSYLPHLAISYIASYTPASKTITHRHGTSPIGHSYRSAMAN